MKKIKETLKVKKEPILKCNRCEIDSIHNPDRMIPCPRGSCEAEVVGTLKITKEIILK